MPLDDVRSEDVAGRRATEKLLREHPQEALAVARRIRHPWYRCQALAAVADAADTTSHALRIITESLAAAYEQAEPNRIVTVATWPLRTLLELDPQAASQEVESLISIASLEQHGLRRLHALDFLISAVVTHPALRSAVARPYLHTAQHCNGWRAERIVAFRAQHIAAHDLSLAHQLLAGRQSNRFVNRARHTVADLARNGATSGA